MMPYKELNVGIQILDKALCQEDTTLKLQPFIITQVYS
jgi:hypothetical protein